MKSAEEILKEQLSVAFKTKITDEAWNKMKEGLEGYQGVINAIIEYGKQVVDKCAQEVRCADIIFNGWLAEQNQSMKFLEGEDYVIDIDEDSILNVKNLLT